MSTAVQVHNGSAPVEEPGTALAVRTAMPAPVVSADVNFGDLMQLSQELVPTGFLPDHIKTPGQCAAIILTGRELGMAPMRALRSLSMVKGKVVESADSQLARFKTDGGRAQFLRLDETGAELFLRHPNGDEHTELFSIEDAKKAGLLGNNQWQKFPKAMLRSRAITAGLKSVGWEGGAGTYDPDEAVHFTPPAASTPATTARTQRAAATATATPTPEPEAAAPATATDGADDQVTPACPECQGLMWDNRKTKTNPKAPDYKCRDRECEGKYWPGQWPPKAPDTTQTELPVDGSAAGRAAAAPAAPPAAAAAAAGPCFPKNKKFPDLSNVPLRDISTEDLKSVLPWLRDLGQDALSDAIAEILVEREEGLTDTDEGLPEALKTPTDDLPF